MLPIADLEVATGRLRLTDSDGRVVEEELRPFAAEVTISRIRIDFDAQLLSLALPDETSITVALHLGAARQEAYLSDRTIVYLDQNHWSKLAAARCGGQGVSTEDAAAAEVLAGLADQRHIVLPLSAGHAVETGALYGLRRTQIASAMLGLSQGWLMRHPSWIRSEEFATAREGLAGATQRVFVQDADQLFTRPLRNPSVAGLPAPMAALGKPIINVLSIATTLTHPEKMSDVDGRAAAAAWAQSRQDAADCVRADHISAERARQVANAQTLWDSNAELLMAWPDSDPDARGEWLKRTYDDVGQMPCLSRVRAIFYARLRNGSRWYANDFTDIMYLSCAAGYADLVVGERRTIGELRTARNITHGARLASHLPDAIAALEEMGCSV
ncbi:MAG: hypothetical protein WBP81_30925 [Solirubrobacteraceae bacterium]